MFFTLGLFYFRGDVGPEKKSEVITLEVRQHLQPFSLISKRKCKDETKFQPCNISLHSKFKISTYMYILLPQNCKKGLAQSKYKLHYAIN